MKTLMPGFNNSCISFICMFLFAFFALTLLPESIYAQEIADVVYLKNGDILRGVIVEQIPFESIKMELPGGSTITVKYSDIAKITKERTDTNRELIHQRQTPKLPKVQPQQPVQSITQNAMLISLGYGNSFGGLGVNLSINIFPTNTFHIGGGWFPLSILHEGADDMFLVAGGARVFFAGPEKKSRSYLDLQFGMIGAEYEETRQYQNGILVSITRKQQALFGPSILLGTEAFWGAGNIGGRIAGGGSYNLAEVDWIETDFLWAFDIGLILKL